MDALLELAPPAATEIDIELLAEINRRIRRLTSDLRDAGMPLDIIARQIEFAAAQIDVLKRVAEYDPRYRDNFDRFLRSGVWTDVPAGQ